MGTFNLTIGTVYLYGLVSYQYVTYATLEFDDPIWLRSFVVILFAIDTSQTIVELWGVWYFAKAITDVTWVWPFCGVGNSISTLIVQYFFLHRLWGFTRQVWLCGFLALLAVGGGLFGVIGCTKVGLLVDVTKLGPTIPLVTAWLAIEAGLDIIITTILSRALWRSKTGVARTNTIIHRCIRAAIQSGLFTSVFAFAALLGFVFWTDTYLYLIFGWPVGRIYSSTFLYTLIIRKDLSRIAYGTSQAGHAGVNSFPVSLQISSVRFRRDTAAETGAGVGGDDAKTSLDSPPTGSA
ncbi:hypothetical protein DL96DRAFT_1552100 [Flagelloscypha sp. PMI_526]|nr:hypothetical protein DL96DRAFT_1552100 [Flagelloscypha sp. PMI_526]